METIQLGFFIILCLGVHRSSSEILQRRKRNWIIDSFKIKESYKGPFPYPLGRINIEGNLTLFKIEGQGVDEEPKGILQIDPRSGHVTVHGAVDYEEFNVLRLKFLAYDMEKHEIDTKLGIEIQIEGTNDNTPMFEHERYEVSIAESIEQGTDVIAIKANDLDAENVNQVFNFNIISVTPKSQSVEFYITQTVVADVGIISFRGCLDHETAEKYTIIVEVKDGGEIQLFSSCTVIVNVEDGNNHLPEIIGHTAPEKVKEGVENVLISRVQVRDKDSKGTAAWRVKYKIHGDTGNFRISTDPETNDGLLYLEKQLDYEETPLQNVTITVENEISFYDCKVVNRKAIGLWEIATVSADYAGSGIGIGGATWTETLSRSRQQVTLVVMVENVNEPPVFGSRFKEVTVLENAKAGQSLWSFIAKDPDTKSVVKISYIKGDDPAGWVTVDAETGKITTSKALDRESPFVNQSIYTVTIYAVDSGIPPMTATATLNIHIFDENDNAPALNVSTIDICQSDGPSLTPLTAVDLDEEPYSGPFTFKLLGHVEGKWRLDPHQGSSVNLVKENTVHSGQFKLMLEVSDRQQKAAVHNLSVTVCQCSDVERPNCRSPKARGATVGGEALGAAFFGLLLLAAMTLLVLLVSCQKMDSVYSSDIKGVDSGQYLMYSNTEMPGTDCKVAFESLFQEQSQNVQESQLDGQNGSITMGQSVTMAAAAESQARWEQATAQKQQQQRKLLHWSKDATSLMRMRQQEGQNRDYMHKSIDASSMMRLRQQEAQSRYSMHKSIDASSMMRMGQQEAQSRYNMHKGYMTGSKYVAMYEVEAYWEILSQVLNTTLHSLQVPGGELGDYAPRVYADEGDTEINYELDAINIPDIPFDPDLDLDMRFIKLASICMPPE